MNRLGVVQGIVVRDLLRATRQRSRMLGGLARPFMWLLLVGTGYGAIARVEGGSYPAYVFPGVVAMAVLFGGMLTAISTVYDREFGMLRLMLVSPAGAATILSGRMISAAVIGGLQGTVVLAAAPLVLHLSPARFLAAAGALVAGALCSGAMGLLVASRLRSVENFAGVINVVLFPLLFLSGAFYPVSGLPAPLQVIARVNPVSYQVDLLRHAMGQAPDLSLSGDLLALGLSTAVALVVATLWFDPERRVLGSGRPAP